MERRRSALRRTGRLKNKTQTVFQMRRIRVFRRPRFLTRKLSCKPQKTRALLCDTPCFNGRGRLKNYFQTAF
ncbi:hypothetical protein [Kingella potus]|uniref:hypothetical protein n=1 Tax=Kingella potus TaxID=265175 RepID=UPI001FD2B050|nr:hypothetical protein [Kingella potus]UOP01432.1 hypothetical protein LVJ84_04280 [Kingella potus]